MGKRSCNIYIHLHGLLLRARYVYTCLQYSILFYKYTVRGAYGTVHVLDLCVPSLLTRRMDMGLMYRKVTAFQLWIKTLHLGFDV